MFADDDKSMLTEQIEPLPKMSSPLKQLTAVQNKQTQQKKTEKQEKPVKPKAKGVKAKGRISTPERKPARKEPVYIPREDIKKKKGSWGFPFCLLLSELLITLVYNLFLESIKCTKSYIFY